jgi:recombination protein RecA
MSSSRRRKLDAVVARLQLEHGPRAIRRAGPDERTPPAPRIATSFTELDAALGGGLPQGRISEIAGATTSGKLTLAAKTIATAHRRDREALAAWIDPHNTCDPDYLHRCGVILDRLLVVRPATVSDALAVLLHLVMSRALAVLVCDWTPQADPGLFTASEEAALGGTLAQLNYQLTNASTAVIFLTESTAASASLAHAAAVRIRLQREQWLMRHGDVHGYTGQVEIVKNRLGRAGARVPLRIEFNGTVRGAGL